MDMLASPRTGSRGYYRKAARLWGHTEADEGANAARGAVRERPIGYFALKA